MSIKNPNDGKYIADTAQNRSIIRSGQYSNTYSNTNSYNGYYQSQDSYVGSSNEASFLTKIVLYIVGLGLFYEALNMITPYFANYANYSYPYKPIAIFYDYTITVPYQTVDRVWYWLASLELAAAENTSFIIACIGIAIYACVLLFLYSIWINTIAKIFRHPVTNRPSRGAAWLLFILLALFALIWYIVPVTWHFIIDLINYL